MTAAVVMAEETAAIVVKPELFACASEMLLLLMRRTPGGDVTDTWPDGAEAHRRSLLGDLFMSVRTAADHSLAPWWAEQTPHTHSSVHKLNLILLHVYVVAPVLKCLYVSRGFCMFCWVSRLAGRDFQSVLLQRILGRVLFHLPPPSGLGRRKW